MRRESDAAARRRRRAEQGEELASTYNSMLCVDDKGAPTNRMKEFCPECGLPRDPEHAKTTPCGACGALGTVKKAPQFDDYGEKIPDEVVEQRNAERVERLRQRRERKRTAQEAIVEDHPTSDAAIAVELAQKKPTPKVEKPKQANLADLFLAAM